jgi:hypothetical protein
MGTQGQIAINDNKHVTLSLCRFKMQSSTLPLSKPPADPGPDIPSLMAWQERYQTLRPE